MAQQHTFQATLKWNKTAATIEDNKKIYHKSHTITIAAKPNLSVSAAKVFKGDPALYNPEELLLASIVSCHMMSYLYVCTKNNIEVISYTDEATAILETFADGSGKMVEVQLYPIITIVDESQTELALSLHTEANKLCFIANSCNFPVKHYPIIKL